MNIPRFYNDFQSRTALKLTPKRVSALDTLLPFFGAELDRGQLQLRELAYMLATVQHETAGTFAPIKEYRAPAGTPARTNQDRYWLSGFYGRGYVQLTWVWNYKKMTKLLRASGVLLPSEDLFVTPDLALTPRIAYAILREGMVQGTFTGRKLSHYITPDKTDYLHARRIVNGMDKAQLIAGYAAAYELLLRAATT